MAENLKEIKHESEVKPIDREQFKADIQALMTEREDVATANQALGNTYKNLEKDRGYHPQAVKECVKLMKKSDENRDAYVSALLEYFDILGFLPKPTLFDAAAARDGGEAPDVPSKRQNSSRARRAVADALN